MTRMFYPALGWLSVSPFVPQVTKDVSLLSRWMAIDLYIREVDSLRFELSMNRCSDSLSRLAHEILEGLSVEFYIW